jgi:hypothetical protein
MDTLVSPLPTLTFYKSWIDTDDGKTNLALRARNADRMRIVQRNSIRYRYRAVGVAYSRIYNPLIICLCMCFIYDVGATLPRASGRPKDTSRVSKMMVFKCSSTPGAPRTQAASKQAAYAQRMAAVPHALRASRSLVANRLTPFRLQCTHISTPSVRCAVKNAPSDV